MIRFFQIIFEQRRWCSMCYVWHELTAILLMKWKFHSNSIFCFRAIFFLLIFKFMSSSWRFKSMPHRNATLITSGHRIECWHCFWLVLKTLTYALPSIYTKNMDWWWSIYMTFETIVIGSFCYVALKKLSNKIMLKIFDNLIFR